MYKFLYFFSDKSDAEGLEIREKWWWTHSMSHCWHVTDPSAIWVIAVDSACSVVGPVCASI